MHAIARIAAAAPPLWQRRVNASPRTCRILVASDATADAAQVRKLLADEFDTVEVSTTADLAVADFERVLPGVIVLAFDALDKAQQYCLGLLRLSKVAHSHPHRIVILCAKGDLDAVFDLCKKEYFDDYVLFWPLAHDGHRLAMTVWGVCRRLLDRSADSLAARARSYAALGLPVGHELAEGMRHVAAAQESPAIAETLPAARPVVLIVEDDAFAAKLIAKALDQQNFDLEFANDAPAVLAMLRRLRPAVILMDVNMPGMDGVALTEWLQASPSYRQIPVIMLTGDARRETIERSVSAGAAGFIVKPFTRDNLLNKLARFVQKSGPAAPAQ